MYILYINWSVNDNIKKLMLLFLDFRIKPLPFGMFPNDFILKAQDGKQCKHKSPNRNDQMTK